MSDMTTGAITIGHTTLPDKIQTHETAPAPAVAVPPRITTTELERLLFLADSGASAAGTEDRKADNRLLEDDSSFVRRLAQRLLGKDPEELLQPAYCEAGVVDP